MIAPHSPDDSSPPKERVLKILEQIERIGFPNKDNIDILKKLIGDLAALATHFKNSDRIAIRQLEKAIYRIEFRIKEDGDISIRMYTAFHKPLIILRTALRVSHDIPL